MVQTNTVIGPGGEAGVMRIKGTGQSSIHERGLAMALDGNGRWCYLDPKLGAMHAVAEAARKVACTGATARGCDQLPELRQSGKAGDHGAAFGGHRRHRRSLHRAGHADHRRQCFALQRDQRRRHLSHARSRHRRNHGRRDQGRAGELPAGRRCHSAVVAHSARRRAESGSQGAVSPRANAHITLFDRRQSTGDRCRIPRPRKLRRTRRCRHSALPNMPRSCSAQLWGTPPPLDLDAEADLQTLLDRAG